MQFRQKNTRKVTYNQTDLSPLKKANQSVLANNISANIQFYCSVKCHILYLQSIAKLSKVKMAFVACFRHIYV